MKAFCWVGEQIYATISADQLAELGKEMSKSGFTVGEGISGTSGEPGLVCTQCAARSELLIVLIAANIVSKNRQGLCDGRSPPCNGSGCRCMTIGEEIIKTIGRLKL